MRRFFHIGFVLGGADFKRLEPHMQGIGDWVRYSATNWIVWTDKNAEQIYSLLKPHVGNDQFLIVEINMSERNGWLSQWIWQWMNDRWLASASPSSVASAFNPYPWLPKPKT